MTMSPRQTASESSREVSMRSFMSREPATPFDVTGRSLISLVELGFAVTRKIEETSLMQDAGLLEDADTACLAATNGLQFLRRALPGCFDFIAPMPIYGMPAKLALNVADKHAHLAAAQANFDLAVGLLARHADQYPFLQELSGMTFESHQDKTGRFMVMATVEEVLHGLSEDGDPILN